MRALAVSVVGHGVLVASLTQVDRAPRVRAEAEADATIVVEWGLPCVKCIAEDFEKWMQDPYGGHTVNLLGLLPVLRGSFDLTDFVERLAGNDPYSYEKNELLEATRERRAQMSGNVNSMVCAAAGSSVMLSSTTEAQVK